MDYKIIFVVMLFFLPVINLIIALTSHISYKKGGKNKKGKINSYGAITPAARQSVRSKRFADKFSERVFGVLGLAEIVICIVVAVVVFAAKILIETLVVFLTYAVIFEAIFLMVGIFSVEIITWKKFDGGEGEKK